MRRLITLLLARSTCFIFLLLLLIQTSLAQSGGQVSGRITDRTAGALASAKVTLKNLATQSELTATTDSDGRYQFDNVSIGIYRLRVEQEGFSTVARNITLTEPGEKIEANFDLSPGAVTEQVSVTAARGERDELEVPVRTEAIGSEELIRQNNTTTQDALTKVPNVTVVGNGPFQQRPRLRGLDSSRILILVDGERLNTSRVATDRAGVEVGLVDPSNLQSVEVISGSGSVLYGTDALSGTINFLTNQPVRVAEKFRIGGGLNTFYSTNEDGRRGTAELNMAGRKFAVRFSGMLERYANYHAGESFAETSAPFINRVTVFSTTPSSALRPPPGFVTQQIFGGLVPDSFNAPFTRTSSEVPNSQSHGNAVNGVGRIFFTDNDVLRLSWNRRRNDNIGFPDFAPPIFFQKISLPFSNLDKYGLRYQKSGLTPWFAGLSINVYHQVQDRNLRNDFSAFSLDGSQPGVDALVRVEVLSDTRQNVKSYGYDVQTNFLLGSRNILTAGTSYFRDHSRDSRESRQRGTITGFITRPPAPARLIPQNIPLFNTLTFPQRVPKSNFQNIGVFVQDEYDVTRRVRLIGGLRYDRFDVDALATPGYNPLLPGIERATPPIDLSKLPSASGASINRNNVSGDIGLVVRVFDDLTVSGRVGRSYRHPNLEELFFTGPATIGNIIASPTVKPETGINVDFSAKLRKRTYTASFNYFNNHYRNFISTEFIANAPQPTGLIAQAINFAKVRLQGFEADGEYSFSVGNTVLTPYLNVAYLRGDIIEALSPFSGQRLTDVPADNISPLKAVAGFRWQTNKDRWWTEYYVRAQAHVERVSPLLSDSPFLIAQDLFGLRGFGVQTWRGGYNFNREHGRVTLTLGLENFTNEFYREQFQFAPARGRSFTVGLLLKYF
jgi:hemoglobin/transferrin/lactoferrin receptor protein